MAKIKSQVTHISGIPLGGLGTGTIEIRPDGNFYEWEIFNQQSLPWAWPVNQPECCNVPKPEMPQDAFSFFVWAKPEGELPIVRSLSLRSGEKRNLYSFSWLKNVEEIEFDGKYPVASLKYIDKDLPVYIESIMFSPFVPHNARYTGTPGFYVIFKIKNILDKLVNVSLLSKLKNPINAGIEDRMLENSISRSGDTVFLTMRTKKNCHPTSGSLCLSVSGGDPSWICGDYSAYFDGFAANTSYGLTMEWLLYDFRRKGRLPNLDARHDADGILPTTDEEIDALTLDEMKELLDKLKNYAFVNSLWERVCFVDNNLLESREGLAVFLKNIKDLLIRFKGKTWGDGALCSSIVLQPHKEKEIYFVLSWYFPNHYSANRKMLGHMYENWFRDAEDVNRFMVMNFDDIRRTTCKFSEELYNTNLDPVFPDAWSSQLSTIVKSSWWIKNGKFAIWEGLGCCGLNTTDITYQGSFNVLALFPELQKNLMKTHAGFQRSDGRIPHLLAIDLDQVDRDFGRVDMNPQFVLLVCRDYLWTGDRNYIKDMWSHIVKAMENTEMLDTDGDGLPDSDTQKNTYDNWKFTGTPSYIASLWLAALVAGIRLAEDLGEKYYVDKWGDLLRKGIASFDRKLWNGEYYSLWVDGDKRDECCMTDQISGEWFIRLTGIGRCLPESRINSVLKAIFKYNFTKEGGLVNASYPPSAKTMLSAYRNLQAEANWTGIEYAFSSMLIDSGMFHEGYEIIKNIHKRYSREGMIWNHIECGEHYYRAMSSWAVLLAVTGFKIDVPRGIVTFRPINLHSEFHGPWVSSTGWGHFVRSGKRFVLNCYSGTLAFRKIQVSLPDTDINNLKAYLNGKILTTCLYVRDSLVVADFEGH